MLSGLLSKLKGALSLVKQILTRGEGAIASVLAVQGVLVQLFVSAGAPVRTVDAVVSILGIALVVIKTVLADIQAVDPAAAKK